MRNFHIGTVMGIPIKVNFTLLIFLPVLAWLFSRPAQIELYAGFIAEVSPHLIDIQTLQVGNIPVLIGVFTAVGLFVSVLLHELGHSWTARLYGIPISSITLWIFGGMAHIEDLPEDWNVELRVAITGPVTSALIGLFCYGLLQVIPTVSVLVFVVGWLAVVNLTLAVFNMLPAFPMDGGRILRSILARSRPYVEATRVAAAVGKGVAVLLAIYAVYVFAPFLLLIAMFIYIAAGSESKVTVLRDLLSGMRVRDIMTKDVKTVASDLTVGELASRILSEKATAFPVMDDGQITGFVTLDDVRQIEEDKRETRLVSEVMGDAPDVVSPDTDAFEALQTLSKSQKDRVIVVERDRVVGSVSNADFGSAIEVLQGLGPWRQIKVPDGYA